MFSLSFHTHNTRDPGSRPTLSTAYPVLGGAIWLACGHDVRKNSFPRRGVDCLSALEHNTSRNKYFNNWQQFQPNIFFLKSSKELHKLSLRKKLFVEKLIECHFEDLIYFVYIILKCGVINFLVSGSHIPGWDWCKLSQVFVESFYRYYFKLMLV